MNGYERGVYGGEKKKAYGKVAMCEVWKEREKKKKLYGCLSEKVAMGEVWNLKRGR